MDGTSRTGRRVAGRRALPGPLADTYGAGDSFAAGLTFALAQGRSPQEAVELAAASGSRAMTRHGAARGGDSSF